MSLGVQADRQQIKDFLHELAVVRQLSTHTIEAYEQDLKKLEVFVRDAGLELVTVHNNHARQWAARLHSQGLAPRSIARILSAWRTFFEWLGQDLKQKKLVELRVNPLADVKAPKRAKNLPKALSVEQVMALLDYAKKEAQAEFSKPSSPHLSSYFYCRDLALFELFYSSGLRLSEVLGIDIQESLNSSRTSLGWIDWSGAEVNVLGKGGKRRVVPVGAQAMEALMRWKTMLLEFKHPVDGPLFVNETFKRLSSRSVQFRLKNLAIRAGLPIHVHPHMLRHSFASHVLQSSHDLRAVQEMLGHASIGSTQIYTALDFQHLAQAYDQAHPRAKSTK